MSLLIALSITAALVQAPSPPNTGSVSGRVSEDGSGAPIEDAQVTVMPVRSGPASVSVAELLTVRSDRDGRFMIRGLEPGRYRVAAQKSSYAFVSGPMGVASVEVAAGGDQAVSLTLQRGAAIVGRVVNESGDPLVNLRVMAMRQVTMAPRDNSASRPGPVPAGPGDQTNDLGEFRLFGLPAGEYYVHAAPGPDFGRVGTPRARSLVPTYFPDVTNPDSAQTITLTAGQTSDVIVIRMLEAPAFQVSGVVVDDSGRPVANALVRLDPDPAGGPWFSFGRFLQGRTNASGSFTISNVTAATYMLVAIAPLVISSGTDARTGGGGRVVSFGSGGPVTGGVTSESRNGITTQYRDDNATRAPISVHESDVNGLQVVVRLPR